MKNSYFLTVLVTVCFVSSITLTALAQDKIMPPPEQDYYSLSPTGETSNPMMSLKPPPQKEFSPEKKELLRQLREARLSNDLIRSNEIQSRLNKLEGITGVQTPSDPMIQHQVINNPNPPFENDYVWSPVHGLGCWGNAVATVPVGAPNAGRIYVAAMQAAAGGDSVKFYYSTNGGASWVYYTQFWYALNTDFSPNEIDIEILYDGAAAWLYGVAGFRDVAADQYRVVLFRWNLTTNAFYGITMAWPGAIATNRYYNPRIVSDYPSYTGAAYIYIIASRDSTTGGTKHLTGKYANIQNPFVAAPTVLYPQAGGSGFWWTTSSAPTSAYLWTDIGFYVDAGGTGLDRVFTVFNNGIAGQYNMYLSWSDNYGVSNTGSFVLTETNASRGARIAFNGGGANRNGMIVYLRLFSGSDWDVAYRNTTNGGTATWSALAYIDFTGYRASGHPSLTRLPGGANLFKAAYCEDSVGLKGFYAGFNGTAWASPSRMGVTHVPQDTVFANIVAGFRNGGGDDCLAVWRSGTTFTTYASFLCQTTVGIGNNNEIPLSYSLSQNYPNPFNPGTLINFSIPVGGDVKLVVYNLLGEEVAALVNEYKAAGNYGIEFNASKLASGVYFYKLTSGDFSDTKKLMLIK